MATEQRQDDRSLPWWLAPRTPGDPQLWRPELLLPLADPEPPRRRDEGVFGASLYGIPIPWT